MPEASVVYPTGKQDMQTFMGDFHYVTVAFLFYIPD